MNIWQVEQDRWLPLLLWVPRFKDVRIRVGKTVKDIPAGGILIGLYRPDGRIINGPNSVYGLKEMIVQAKGRNEAVYLTIKNSLTPAPSPSERGERGKK